jgi:hypothetical protein
VPVNKVVTFLVACINLVAGCTSGDDDKDTGNPPDTGTGDATLARVYINEVQSANLSTLQDEVGAFPDWIELWNAEDAEADISGWWITDDVADVFKWQFPAGTKIAPGGFLLLYADEDQEEGPMHVNFALAAAGGENVGLYGPNLMDNPLVDSTGELLPLQDDWSLARQPDGGALVVDDSPTPEAANN